MARDTLPVPPFSRVCTTRSERKLLDQLAEDGVAWVVPSQFRMVRRLAAQGVVEFRQDLHRYDALRGSTVHAVFPKEA